MALVKHPTLETVALEIPDSDVKRWVSTGWVAPDSAVEKDEGGATVVRSSRRTDEN